MRDVSCCFDKRRKCSESRSCKRRNCIFNGNSIHTCCWNWVLYLSNAEEERLIFRNKVSSSAYEIDCIFVYDACLYFLKTDILHLQEVFTNSFGSERLIYLNSKTIAPILNPAPEPIIKIFLLLIVLPQFKSFSSPKGIEAEMQLP